MNSPTQYGNPFLCSAGGVSKQWPVLEQLEERIVLDGTLDDAHDVQDLGADGGHTDKLGWTYIDNGWWKENNDSGWWWERATGWYWNELTGWWKLDSGNFTYWYHGEHQYWANEISTNAWFWWDDVTDQIWEPAFTWFADQVDSEWTWVLNDWNGSQYYTDSLHSLYQDHYGGAWWWFDAVNDAAWEPYQTWFSDAFGVQIYNDLNSTEYIWGNDFHYIQEHTASYVNDPPTAVLPGIQTVDEDTDLTIPRIYVYDVDAGDSPLQISLSVDHGLLTLSATAGLTFVSGNGTEDTAMVFQGTWNQLNTALQSIFYRPDSNFHNSDAVSIVLSDLGNSGSSGSLSISESIAITVLPVNDAPTSDPIPDPPAVDEDFGMSDYDVSSYFHDIDSILSYSLGSITYCGGLTLADVIINPVIGVVTFASAVNSNGSVEIEVIVNDGQYETTRTFTLTVNAVNDSPVNNVPTETQTFLDSLTFGADYRNQISVSDVDAGGDPIRVTLSTPDGTLSVGSIPSGLTITGDGTGVVTLVGSQSEINLALEGLRCTPNAQFAGESTIQIVTDDLGHNGSGASLIDTDVVNMNVNLFVWPFGGTSYWVVHMEGGFYAAQDRNEWIYGTSFDDIISLPNGTHSYIIDAGSGNDGVICYSTQYTYLMGGDGADWLSLVCGNAEISGTAASGWYTGESGTDAYWSGFENVYVSGLPDCHITINTGCEVYWVQGSEGDDTIINNGTVNSIFTCGGNDTITNYGTVVVPINSGEGNDVVNMYGNFNDCSVYGDIGDDDIYIYLDCYSAYVSGSGNEGSAEYTANMLSPVNVIDWYGFERVHVMGSDGQDNFVIGAGATVYEMQGMAGDDTIYNYGTVTAIHGGSGNDDIRNMGTVTDAIHGGDGEDHILNSTGASAERIFGEAGSDYIGNSGVVQFIAGDSWPTSDTIQNDTINLWTGSGTCSVIGSAGYNTIYIESGATVDRVGGDYGTFAEANAGTVLTAIWTGDGDDEVTLLPGSSVYAILTGRGNDTVTNQGTVTGGIDTGYGNDTVNLYDDCTSPYYRVDCGPGSDSLHIYGQNILLSYQIDSEYPYELTGYVRLLSVIIGLDGIEDICVAGTSANDVIEIDSEFAHDVHGWGGDDTITIRSVNSSAKIYGDDGNDSITNRAAISELYGGNGDDTIINYGSVSIISGDTGTDNITNHGGSTYLLITGGAGNDTISNDGIFYLINGDADNDVVYWSGGTGYVYGGTGTDTIYLPSGSTRSGGPGDGTATFSEYMIAIREFESWV